ncbi:hypothetical protein like AT3G29635 [Hibiscus trionum]|uniref:Phenolic glucoside malonyltransferase 1-like n=1 Tax=Hibiscus trionum TaxID=183268 RepID=A0A9W7JKK4_HIBTR|nr:hypothetical protein like AT3G29635 [Hibiscus trionum]
MKILEFSRVIPSPNSPKSSAEFSLPLTFFDVFWLKFPPVERLFFYRLNALTLAGFNSEILPKLKQSLSLALLHYLPLAGNLKWPSNAPKPIISYTPSDGVPLTVAESDADFNLLSSNIGVYEAVELHPLTPELITSDDSATTIALQITLFPDTGFCVGIAAHHAVLDGKTTTMFIKSWAYICKQGNPENSSLPPELTPVFDRTVLKDPGGLDMIFLKNWLDLDSMGSDSDAVKKSLKIFPNKGEAASLVRATVEISQEDLKKLRERVLSKLPDTGKDLHLSTFVLTYAYIMACKVRSRGGNGDRDVAFGFTVDCRPRLDPPVPENYFGSCNTITAAFAKARDFLDENGFVFGVQKVSDQVKQLQDNGVLEGIETKLSLLLNPGGGLESESLQVMSVAGSPGFGVYGSDFGWGKPVKVVIVSIDKHEAVSLAESRDGSRGVEIGLALKKPEVEKFSSLFLAEVEK